jgi:hypothetical protein
MGTPIHPAGPVSGNTPPTPLFEAKRAWIAIVAMAGLIAAVIGIVIFLAKRPRDSAGMRTSVNTNAALQVSLSGLSPDQKQQAYEDDVAALQNRLTRLRSYLDGFPKELIDVDALAATLTTPQAAFEFLRDRIAFEPYPGVMKGPHATLLTRGGDSLDRSLLLAAILKRNGVPARIAHGKLTADQAQKLLEQIAAQPGSVEQILRSLPAHTVPANPTDDQKKIGERLEARRKEAGKALKDAVERTLPLLQSAFQRAGGPNGPANATKQSEMLQDHYWVTATVDNQATDLDPSAKDARVNSKLTTAVDAVDPDNLEDALYQHVRFRLVGEFLDNDKYAVVQLGGTGKAEGSLVQAELENYAYLRDSQGNTFTPAKDVSAPGQFKGMVQFLPGTLQRGSLVFPVPEQHGALTFVLPLPGYPPLELNLPDSATGSGARLTTATAPTLFTVSDGGTLEVQIHGAHWAPTLGDAQPEGGKRFLVLDLTLVNKLDQGIEFQTSQQLKLLNGEEEILADTDAMQKLAHPLNEDSVVPAHGRGRFEVAYQVPSNAGKLVLYYRGFNREGKYPLAVQ